MKRIQQGLLCLILISAVAPIVTAAVPGIPDRVGKFRIEIAEPGNDFAEAEKKKDIRAELPPAIIRWSDRIATQFELSEFYHRTDGYRLFYDYEFIQYKFYVTDDGNLYKIIYTDEDKGVEESPGLMVIKGTRKDSPLTAVPAEPIKLLEQVFGQSPSKAWTTDTPAGLRHILQFGKVAVFIAPDGKITCAGRIDEDKALEEINRPKPKPAGADTVAPIPDDRIGKLEKILGQYRDRFSIRRKIDSLGTKPTTANGGFRFVVMGDSRSNEAVWNAIVAHIDQLDPRPSFVINSGDLIYGGTAEEFAEYLVPPLLKTQIPYFFALGNHDRGANGLAWEYRYLCGEDALNYFFDFGGYRFVVIDNCSKVLPPARTLQWLDRTLASTPQGLRKIVVAHQPVTAIEKWAYHAWTKPESEIFVDLMEKHRVSEVFFGHIHAYSTAELKGIHYTVVGGGGARLHTSFGPQGTFYHYLLCDVAPDGTMTQKVIKFIPDKKK
jgi:hypothetical protein